MAADDVDTIVLVVNNADEPPFASLISTKPDHKILARIDFPSAKNGLEQRLGRNRLRSAVQAFLSRGARHAGRCRARSHRRRGE
jgi:hypothetical protein